MIEKQENLYQTLIQPIMGFIRYGEWRICNGLLQVGLPGSNTVAEFREPLYFKTNSNCFAIYIGNLSRSQTFYLWPHPRLKWILRRMSNDFVSVSEFAWSGWVGAPKQRRWERSLAITQIPVFLRDRLQSFATETL
jgi:hypothetical protein